MSRSYTSKQYAEALAAAGSRLPQFTKSSAQEIGKILLRRVRQLTPVKTGNLIRHWRLFTEATPTETNLIIKNTVEYASYVEYGHRTRNHSGWVEGRHMMTDAINKTQSQIPRILEIELMRWWSETL